MGDLEPPGPRARCSGCWPVRPTAGRPSTLASGLARLDPTAEDKRQARETLLGLLARRDRQRGGRELVRAGWPGSTRQRKTSARPARRCSGCWPARADRQRLGGRRAGGRAGPARPDGGGKRQAREALLGLLARETSGWAAAAALADGLAQLDPTAEDKRQARGALLGLLARETSSWPAEELVGGLAQLDPTAEDKRQARDGAAQAAGP